MSSLNIGTDVVAIKDAVRQVRHNIRDLKERKSQIQLTGEAAKKILQVYEEKISAQQILLLWLRRSI